MISQFCASGRGIFTSGVGIVEYASLEDITPRADGILHALGKLVRDMEKGEQHLVIVA